MARAIADRHRENFESTQRDLRDFQKEKDSIQFVDDAKVTEEDEEKNRKEEMEFEFNADNETLESLGESVPNFTFYKSFAIPMFITEKS